MTQFQLHIDGQERAFEVTRQGDRLHVSAGEDLSAEVRLLHRDGDALLIEIRAADGQTRRVRLAGARAGDARSLWVEGRHLSAERVRRAAARAADPGSLASTIQAVVSKVLVAEGDAVAPGDKLILLESMKMVIPILAPHGGRVARILCAAGDSVPAGAPLLEIEAA